MAKLVVRKSPVFHLGVQLTKEDIDTIHSLAKENGLTFSSISRFLGVSRPYLYQGLTDGSLELSKYLKLQHLLGSQLITHTDLHAKAKELAWDILQHSILTAG